MKRVDLAAQFRRDVRKMEKRGADMSKLREVVLLLGSDEALPPRYKDHGLTGEWRGCRDLHIEPDWLVIYEIRDDVLWLARTGTHADLFGK